MSHALVFIADGFEEIEALTSVDLLRRGGVDVKTVSVGGGNLRKGAHGVQILCDTLLSSADWDQADMPCCRAAGRERKTSGRIPFSREN